MAHEAFSDYSIATLLHARGYQDVQNVYSSPRNLGYKAVKSGQAYFAKFNLSGETAAMAADVWWCQTVARLALADAPIEAPKVVDSGPGWLIEEWMEAPLLVPNIPQQGDGPFEPHISQFVAILGWLDHVDLPANAATPTSPRDSTPSTNLLPRLDGWLEASIRAGRVSAPAVATAKQFVVEQIPAAESGFAHGDFVPWHMMVLPSGRISLFDGEHASSRKLRYYDLAYLYTRLYTIAAAPNTARTLLRQFADQLSETDHAHFSKELLPVMTLRALGMQADAYNDRAQYDYAPAARDILDRCLSRDLNALLIQ